MPGRILPAIFDPLSHQLHGVQDRYTTVARRPLFPFLALRVSVPPAPAIMQQAVVASPALPYGTEAFVPFSEGTTPGSRRVPEGETALAELQVPHPPRSLPR